MYRVHIPLSQAPSCILQIGYPDTTTENNDKEIQDLNINVNTINMTVDLPVCKSIQKATAQDAHLQDLKASTIHGWPYKKDDIQEYGPIRHELALIDGVAIKGKGIIIPSQLQMQILRKHMGIEED